MNSAEDVMARQIIAVADLSMKGHRTHLVKQIGHQALRFVQPTEVDGYLVVSGFFLTESELMSLVERRARQLVERT